MNDRLSFQWWRTCFLRYRFLLILFNDVISTANVSRRWMEWEDDCV